MLPAAKEQWWLTWTVWFSALQRGGKRHVSISFDSFSISVCLKVFISQPFYFFPASLSSFDYPVLLYFSSQSFLTLRYVGVGEALTHCVSELPTSGKVPKGVSLLKATAAAYIKAYSCQKSLLVMKQSDFLNFLHNNDQLSLLMDDLEDFCMKSSS